MHINVPPGWMYGSLHSFDDRNKNITDHIIGSYDCIIRSYNAAKPHISYYVIVSTFITSEKNSLIIDYIFHTHTVAAGFN